MAIQPQTHLILGMAEKSKDRMFGKQQLLTLLDSYRRAHGYSHNEAEVMFCHAYNAQDIAVDDELRAAYPTLSAPTLKRWRLTLKADGIAALGGSYGKTKGRNCIDEQEIVRDHIVGFLVQFPHAQATRVLEFLKTRITDKDVTLPSERTLQRWLGDWKKKNEQTFSAVTNPDQWKNEFLAAMGKADDGIVRLNQLWEMDGTPADIQFTDGRYCLSAVIDVYSRRMAILVVRAARSEANALLLRNQIVEWGKPESAKTDQGPDYIGNHFTAFLSATGIEHLLCAKFSPQRKPHIERGLKTFLHDLVELMPGYCGHNVADAQELRAQKSFAQRLFEKNAVVEMKMTSEAFQQFANDWCEKRYAHREHGQLNGRTPFQMAAEWREPIVRIEDERALDLLLLEIPGSKGMRMVQKKGIKVEQFWFVAPELEAHIGKQVHCKFIDAGSIVVYSTDPWEFLCVAYEPDLKGLSREEIASKAREIQKRRVQEERAALREISKSINAKDAALEILRGNVEASSKIAQFPQRAETTTTPALQAAADLHAALNAPRLDSSTLMSTEEFTQRRDEDNARREANRDMEPAFDSVLERVTWLINQSYSRPLSGEQQSYVDMWRKQNAQEAREVDAFMERRHRGKQVLREA